jgi:hypothetical protein
MPAISYLLLYWMTLALLGLLVFREYRHNHQVKRAVVEVRPFPLPLPMWNSSFKPGRR